MVINRINSFKLILNKSAFLIKGFFFYFIIKIHFIRKIYYFWKHKIKFKIANEVRQAATVNNDYYLVEKDDMENFMYRCMRMIIILF